MSRDNPRHGPKDWTPGHGAKSPEAVDLEHWLKGVVLVGGEGEVDLGRKGPVYIAVIHDGSGFNPVAVITVDQNQYHDLSSDVIERAYEILQDRDMKDEARVKELQEEWGDRWEEILTEAYDGKVWVFHNPLHAASAILTDPRAKEHITIQDPAKACERCGEPEGVSVVRFSRSYDPPTRMCRECREEREEREESREGWGG